jgi:hypothetical protein
MKRPYAGYDVLAKWRTPSFDDKTREALARRLEPAKPPRFFTPDEFRDLAAVVARIYPQEDRPEPIPIAAWIDQRIADKLGQGYRNEHMPPDDQAWRAGLAGVAAEAQRRFGRDFCELAPEDQDAVLRWVQAGDVDHQAWSALEPQRFFRDLLLRVVAALAYGHPSGWSEIGFGGPASPRGYVRLGFDVRDPWEAKEQPT